APPSATNRTARRKDRIAISGSRSRRMRSAKRASAASSSFSAPPVPARPIDSAPIPIRLRSRARPPGRAGNGSDETPLRPFRFAACARSGSPRRGFGVARRDGARGDEPTGRAPGRRSRPGPSEASVAASPPEASVAGQTIRIEDLRHPILNDEQKAALAYGEATPVELTVEAVLAA